jgi:hypothetical protein
VTFWTGFWFCTTVFFLGSGVSITLKLREALTFLGEYKDEAVALRKALSDQVSVTMKAGALAAQHEARAIAAHNQYVTAANDLTVCQRGLVQAITNNNRILDQLRELNRRAGITDNYGETVHGEEG